MYLRRFISSVLMNSRSILVTDPALVKNAVESKALIGKKDLAVRFRIPEALYQKLEARQIGNEESFVFGSCIGPATMIGQHGSDSGLTCITKDPPFDSGKEGNEEGFDWTEFVMTTLSSPEVTCDEEAFPVLKWFSRIPLAGSTAAVYGYGPKQSKDGVVFDGFMIKGL